METPQIIIDGKQYYLPIEVAIHIQDLKSIGMDFKFKLECAERELLRMKTAIEKSRAIFERMNRPYIKRSTKNVLLKNSKELFK